MTSVLETDVGRTGHAKQGVPAMRHVLTVARDRPDLCDYFKLQFARSRDVEVVVDRRNVDRRQDDDLLVPDRRQEQRRTSIVDVTATLWTEGYVLVRVS
jgi:hypothetical protein